MKCGLPPTQAQPVLPSEIRRTRLVIARVIGFHCSRLLHRVNWPTPFWSHTTEVGPYVASKCALRIEHDRSARASPKHAQMPTCSAPIFVPFDSEQRKSRQGLP